MSLRQWKKTIKALMKLALCLFTSNKLGDGIMDVSSHLWPTKILLEDVNGFVGAKVAR